MALLSTRSSASTRDDVVIEAREIGVRFPDAAVDAVRDISFSLSAGETLAVLGPSGSGKSSLALALLGAIPNLIPAARRGDIILDGRALDEASLARRRLPAAAILQDADAQIVALTVEDEIAFALENRGAPADEIEARIEAALAGPPAAGLSRRDQTLQLSGGWRQRLSLAAAFAEEPRLLVIDEPVAHLDGQAAADALDALASIRAHGCASIIVEHKCQRLADLADLVLILDRRGRPVVLSEPAGALQFAAAQADGLGLRLPAEILAEAALRRAGFFPPARLGDASAPVSDAGPAALAVVLDALALGRLNLAPAMRGPPLLSIEDADVRRGARSVLRGVSLTVSAGEIVGLTGPNGAGKTSLAFLAAGALRARRGAVRRKGAAPIYAPQNPSLAFSSNSLAFEASRRGLSWAAVAASLERLDLPTDASRHPLSFSHGEKRRLTLALAAASAGERLMIFDEPTSGLDQHGVATLREVIRDLQRCGCGVALIAHDLDFLASVCDRIAVMDSGRIIMDAHPTLVAARALAGKIPVRASEGLRVAVQFGWRPPELHAQ